MFKQSSKLINGSLAMLAIGVFAIAAVTDAVGQKKSRLTSIFDKGKVIASDIFFAPPAADIDQCANGGVGQPPVRCIDNAWQNGNLNESQSSYVEGDSVPYRDVFTDLVVNDVYTITIEYDSLKGGKHAIDYLTSFDRTETDADPCSDVLPGCDPNTPTSFIAIPAAPIGSVPQVPGQFEMWGGTITGVSGYTVGTSADAPTSITISFTDTSTTAVLAWGGHIATRLDWGIDNSAVAISGAPYHMRNVAFTINGVNRTIGNQDRSLSAGAVYFPSQIQIIKVVSTFDGTGSSTQPFTFNVLNAPITTFNLVDDNAGSGIDTQTISFTSAPAGVVQINEVVPADWSFNGFTNCTISAGGGATEGSITTNAATATVSINLLEANIATCTFNNLQAIPTAAQATVSGQVRTAAGVGIRGALVTVVNATTGESRATITNSFGYYTIGGLDVENLYQLSVSSKRYTFSNPTQWIDLNEDVAGITFTSDQ